MKTVNVQVESGSTEHALLTGAKKTRRRRNANLTSPTPSSEVAPAATPTPDISKNAVKVMKAEPVAAPVAPAPALSPQVAPPAAAAAAPALAPLGPPQPPQIASSSPVTPAPAVKIAPKNGGQTPPTPVPRLLPKKRIGAAPAAETMKAKPTFVVKPEDSQQGGTRTPEPATSGTNRGSVSGAQVRSRTRRAFKERRIHLTVQPVKKSRKYRRTLRARVAEMPLQQVRRMLLRKGVLKPKADSEKAPPEEMMRSMLVDYMMLHHAD